MPVNIAQPDLDVNLLERLWHHVNVHLNPPDQTAKSSAFMEVLTLPDYQFFKWN